MGGTGWRRGLVLGGLACAALAAGCGGEFFKQLLNLIFGKVAGHRSGPLCVLKE